MFPDSILGLPLQNALDSLGDGREIVVVRSAPPFHPRGYTPFWGEERVVRVREFEDGRVEVCVARELLGEERAGKGAASG